MGHHAGVEVKEGTAITEVVSAEAASTPPISALAV